MTTHQSDIQLCADRVAPEESDFLTGLPHRLFQDTIAGDSIMKRIILTQGKFAIVDDIDFRKVSRIKWRAVKGKGNATFYAVHMFYNNGKPYEIRMHRFILNVPDNMLTDHRDFNGLNNRRNNLRICNHQQSQQHRRGQKIKNRTSDFKGVSYRTKNGKWQAQIKHNYKSIWIGEYDNEIDAAKAYDQKAIELFGEFAYTNSEKFQL